MNYRLLGIDTGGTFTDFVFLDGDTLRIHKVISTPEAPEVAILKGIREMAIELRDSRVIHGSTVATNAVLEGKGARTAYITNRGLGDVLTIGRQARRELYNLQPQKTPPPVPKEFCLETGGRLAADGEVIEPLTDADLKELHERLSELKPQSVAINLLFSYRDASFERRIADSLPEGLFVSCSSSVLAEQKEYERGITTWLNAYVGPLVQGYLARLGKMLAPARLSVMRSSGNTCAAGQAGEDAVHLLLSGPAGGLSGARFIGKTLGEEHLLTFDMGGTSTDVSLIDGEIALTSSGRIGNYPVGVPMVNMHTIGAGGGSIARVDAGGALLVGPQSAGAVPGPACYGRGSREPTVTDANLVLGHLPRSALLGGSMPLDYNAAWESLAGLQDALGLESPEAVAEGIVRIANEHMAQALRVISVQRGIDPREFTLVAFGGAGGMHVCALADSLGIRRALAPIHAGVLSALGMLVAPPGRQLSQTVGVLLEDCRGEDIEGVVAKLFETGSRELAQEGIEPDAITQKPSLDLCYTGQSFTLNVPWEGLEKAREVFQEQHESVFGHRLELPVELINVRLGLDAPAPELQIHPTGEPSEPGNEESEVYKVAEPVPVRPRTSLRHSQSLPGPVIITDAVSTLYVAPDWQCRPDRSGSLLLTKR